MELAQLRRQGVGRGLDGVGRRRIGRVRCVRLPGGPQLDPHRERADQQLVAVADRGGPLDQPVVPDDRAAPERVQEPPAAVGRQQGGGAGGRVGRGRRRVGRTGRGEEPEPVGPDRQLVPGPGGLPAGGPEGRAVEHDARLVGQPVDRPAAGVADDEGGEARAGFGPDGGVPGGADQRPGRVEEVGRPGANVVEDVIHPSPVGRRSPGGRAGPRRGLSV